MANSKEPSKFSLAMKAALVKRGMNPLRLSVKLGFAYDHMRKVVNGTVLPSPKLLPLICTELGLDLVTMEYFIDQEKKKYGLDDDYGDLVN